MRGIELSEKCFFEKFLPLLRERLPEAEGRIAAGLVGGGSECFGFDDGISRDHDFSDGFYIWLTDEDDIKYGVELARIYRECVTPPKATCARPRHRGVVTVGEFYLPYTGRRGLPEHPAEWLDLPEQALSEATNGRVFLDNVGAFSEIRSGLTDKMPEDVLKKRLAARVITMAQSGQYNFARCLAHGEVGASRLALSEFAEAAISAAFLLNRRYAPYYKWALRALRELPRLGELADSITALLCSTDEAACRELIEEISGAVADELRRQNLSDSTSDYLEPHAYSIFKKIEDRYLRSLHIMDGGR